MFTFYDSSNGSIQSLPEDYLRLSLKDIKNAIYQKSQIQSEKQILLSPQGMRRNLLTVKCDSYCMSYIYESQYYTCYRWLCVMWQILTHVKGHEINEANRAIYLTASESQAQVGLVQGFYAQIIIYESLAYQQE